MEKIYNLIADSQGLRLDRFVSEQCPEVSRTYAQKLINEGKVTVNGKAAKASLKLEYEIVNADTDELHAEGYTIHAAVEGGGKIVRISDRLLSLLAE